MKKLSKITALTLVLTMVMGMTVFAASSPDTHTSTSTTDAAAAAAAAAYAEQLKTQQQTQAALAPAPAAFSEGVTAAAGGATVAIAPVVTSAVNYAAMGAKLLVGPTATVLKAFTLTPAVNSKTTTVSLSIPGIVNGQKIEVIAFDPLTKTWVKLKGVKVKNGKVTFDMGKYTTFSVVSNTVAP